MAIQSGWSGFSYKFMVFTNTSIASTFCCQRRWSPALAAPVPGCESAPPSDSTIGAGEVGGGNIGVWISWFNTWHIIWGGYNNGLTNQHIWDINGYHQPKHWLNMCDRGYNQPKLGGLTWFNQSTIGGYRRRNQPFGISYRIKGYEMIWSYIKLDDC